jgi:16S rRNA (guanine(527)-N(7))-methyltransferase RsmG
VNSAEALELLMSKCGVPADSEAARKFRIYFRLLQKWDRRINLTASTEWPAIGPLFYEGIWAAQLYAQEKTLHLDIGSGAGFPAIPIRILHPEMSLKMVEGRVKKAAFLETVVEELGLVGTRVYNRRLDEHLRSVDGLWDCISWKGLKLGDRDLFQLIARSHGGTQFWMFHGSELAVKSPNLISQKLRLLRSERFPGRKGWRVSIYGSMKERFT